MYLYLLIPALTITDGKTEINYDPTVGHVGFSLVTKGDIWKSLIGAPLKGLSIAL